LYRGEISRPDSRHRLWKPSEDRLLGKLPDEVVAARTGHPIGSVGARRRMLHLKEPGSREFWTPAEDSRLGKLPDIDLAHKLQRTVGAVKNRRKKLGIRACKLND